MSDEGRLYDVLIEDHIGYDQVTGLPVDKGVYVWADENLKGLIANVPGVASVFNNMFSIRYDVTFDPRYERNWVIAEIEAQIKIHGVIRK